LDEAAAAGIHGSSAVHLSTTAIVVAVLEHIAALAGYALRGFQHGGRLP
jgi:hypothetical protein